jgi:hypothetical protein
MRRGFAVAVFLSAYLVSVRADSTPSATIPGSQVIENRLLPILPPSGSFVTPAFKFFEDNKLVGIFTGALKNDKPLISAIHTLPNGFTDKTLKEELTVLNVSAPTNGRTLIVYVSEVCPPCDHIIDDVKSRLPSAGWAKASILLVTVRME